MASGSRDLASSTDFPRLSALAGTELVPVYKTDGSVGAAPTSLFQSASASVGLAFADWVGLSGFAGSANQRAEVYGPDGGSHIDYNGSIVPNVGTYAWVNGLWHRLSDLSATAAIVKATQASTDVATLSASTTALAARVTAVEAAESVSGGGGATPAQLAALEAEIAAVRNAVGQEVGNRAAADATLALDIETRALDSDILPLRHGVLDDPTRPGDAPILFTVDVTGEPIATTPLDPQFCVANGSYGRVYRRRGRSRVSSRRTKWVEPSRIYMARFRFARLANPDDPANHAVQCSLTWLDSDFRLVGSTVVQEFDNATSAQGALSCFAVFPSATVPVPAGAAYVRLGLDTFGADGVTDVIEMALSDVTDMTAYSPSLAQLQSQVDSLSARVAALAPAAAGTPNGLATLDGNGQLAQLPLSRAKVLYAAAQAFDAIQGADYAGFSVTVPGIEQHTGEYFAFNVDRDAPRNGLLYGMIRSYLQTSYPGPGMSASAAETETAKIYDAAATGGVAPSDSIPVTGDAALNDARFRAAFSAFVTGFPPPRGEVTWQIEQGLTALGLSYDNFSASLDHTSEAYFALNEYRDAPRLGVLWMAVRGFLINSGVAAQDADTRLGQWWTTATVAAAARAQTYVVESPSSTDVAVKNRGSVLMALNDVLKGIAGASYNGFVQSISSEASGNDDYFAVYVRPDATIDGPLYLAVMNYLTLAANAGAGMTQAGAQAAWNTIWSHA